MRHALAEQRFFRGNPSPVQNNDVTSRKKHLAQFVDKVDSAIYGINYYHRIPQLDTLILIN